MKNITILLAIFVLISTIDCREDWDESDLMPDSFKKCMAESNIRSTGPDEMKNSNPSYDPEKYKCLTKCMLELEGLVDSTGQLHVDKVKKVYSDNDNSASQIIDECKVLKGANPCETNYLIINCIDEKLED